MADAGSIRAGGAYIEITADDAPMMKRLAASQARLKAWATHASLGMQISKGTEASLAAGEGGGKGFLSGEFRGQELFQTGLRFATAIAATKTAIADVRIFSALVRGDFEGMRAAAEALPFGLGEIVKELSGPVDSWARKIVGYFEGMNLEKSFRDANLYRDIAKRETQVLVDAAKDRTTAARLLMSPQEFVKREAAGMRSRGVSELGIDEAVAGKTAIVQANEYKAGLTKAKNETDAVARARMDLAKATMSDEAYLEMEVKQLGYSADRTAELLACRKELLRVQKEQALEAEREANRVDAEQAGIQVEIDAENKAWAEGSREREKWAKDAEVLKEQMMTPEELGKARVDEILAMTDLDSETRRRAIQQALEDAAGAAMPSPSPSSAGRGQFGGQNAWMLGALGVQNEGVTAAKETAKNTAKIAELAYRWGVAEFD
jgi:hypothetical protein